METYEGEDDISAYVKQKKQVKKTALTQIYNPHSGRYFVRPILFSIAIKITPLSWEAGYIETIETKVK